MVCSLNLGACNHGFSSTTVFKLVSAELSHGGASASMLIALRSFQVITIRPIEADGSSFRILGRNAILFVCFRGKTPNARSHLYTGPPAGIGLAAVLVSLSESDLPECPDDFSSFSQQKTFFNFTSTRATVLGLDISWQFALVHILEPGRPAGRMKGGFPYWEYVLRAPWSTLACM
jgi:hypothetical protein